MTRAAGQGCGCGGALYALGKCHRCYQAHRNRQIAYGKWNPSQTVPGDAARAHVERMRAVGIGPTRLARLAGVDPLSVSRLTREDDVRLTERVRSAILAVPVPERAADISPKDALVPIHGAQRRIRALIAFGYTREQIARELGIHPHNSTLNDLVVGHHDRKEKPAQTITAARDLACKELFERLQMEPGTSERSRAKGRRNGWALPFEWDEEAIDDPHGKPERARWNQGSATAERREQTAELTERGLSASQIAERLGVTERTVQRDRESTKTTVGQPDPQIEAMGEVIVQARTDLAARHTAQAGRERTR